VAKGERRREAPPPQLAAAIHLPAGKPLVITIGDHIRALVMPMNPR